MPSSVAQRLPQPPPGDAEAERPKLPLQLVSRQAPSEAAATRRAKLWGLLGRLRFLPLLLLLVAVGGLIGLYFQPPGLRWAMATLKLEPGGGTSRPIAVPAARPALQQGAPDGRMGAAAHGVVVGLGKILPLGEVVTVAPPYGASDARIAEIPVKEGDLVARGDVLAVLDNQRQLQAAFAAAQATVAAREAALAQTMASVRASRDETRAALARTEATAANALREFERAETLRQRGFAADQTFDQRRAARDEAAREVERLKATLSRYGEGDLAGQADVALAASNRDAAAADAARASAELDRTTVRAPIAGTVLTVHVRAGEKPGSAGILNLGNLEQMIVDVEIYQTQIGAIALQQRVEITAQSLPGKLAGSVTRIGLEVGRQSLIDPSPAANTDARVVKVRVALDSASSELARRFTNLQVVARIATAGQP